MTRILIVDDKEENLYYLEVLLGGNGFEVEVARHGAEALFKARQKIPDVIVSDLLMPVMDGFTLLRYWKTDPRLKSIPFVVYTATYTEAEDERLARRLGADAFILKPSEPEDFLARLREVQSCSAAPRTTPAPHESGAENEILKVYSETLIRKLEEKTLQLEEANRTLREDIAERRRMEENLRESEERFRATFEQAAVGIAHVDLENRFLRVNDKLCEITGSPRDELLGQNCLQLTVPENRAGVDEARQSMLAGSKKSYSAEVRYRRRDGVAYWVNVVTTLLRDSFGQPKYFITVIEDITERRSLEERFLRAQRMESIGTLAGGIAHDLNNILLPISLGIELLRPEVRNESLQRIIDTITSSAQRGANLVKQVLSFARGVEGARVSVHLGHVVREIVALALNTFPKNITIQTDMVRDPWLVSGDPTQLHQVILNLCVNARDAMRSGGRLSLAIRNITFDEQSAATHREIQVGKYVLLEVTDTGCGISSEVLNRIFEPFFTTKELGKGTGLGLSIVLGIVRSHSGVVEVESQVGQGSLFRVYLPALTAYHTEEALPRDTPIRSRGEGETVLVVDDEPEVCKITSQVLETYGYHVLCARDGKEALRLYAMNRERVKLVLTDMMMPNMDGLALAKALNHLEPALPIIAATGVHDEGNVDRASVGGFTHFLAKPFTTDKLLDSVKAALQTVTSDPEPSETEAPAP